MGESKFTFVATDTNFDAECATSDQLTLVDFWAEWCGPCKALGPKLEEIAEQYQGKVKIFKMNVDENPNTPAKYQVRGIPTVIFLKKGQLVNQVVGNQPKDTIVQAIDKSL